MLIVQQSNNSLFLGSPKRVMLLLARGGGQSTAAFSSPIAKAMGSSYVLYLARLHFASSGITYL